MPVRTEQLVRNARTAAALVLTLAAARDTRAQAGFPQVTVDENGVGSIQLFLGGPINPIMGNPAFDPGPGGLPNALTYSLTGAPTALAGDLILQDVAGGPISDVIRFNLASPFGGTNLVFYSDVPEPGEPPSPADIGFPNAFYPLVLNLVEVPIPQGFGIIYTPTPNQPGFMNGANVTYTIISDPIPAPASATLLALAGLTAVRRRR